MPQLVNHGVDDGKPSLRSRVMIAHNSILIARQIRVKIGYGRLFKCGGKRSVAQALQGKPIVDLFKVAAGRKRQVWLFEHERLREQGETGRTNDGLRGAHVVNNFFTERQELEIAIARLTIVAIHLYLTRELPT